MTNARRTLRVGTRGSALALEQTRRVVDALRARDATLQIETQVITTSGDLDKQTSLMVLGGQGVFAKELQAALSRREVDLAVHSVKDLPSELPAGLMIGAVLPRGDARDVLVSRDGYRLAELPPGARVGTSSRRRVIQLRMRRPDLEVVDLRGNIDTRLRKVREGQVDAAVLAAAGVLRMGWQDQVTEFLSLDQFIPAPGQGALGVECRVEDGEVVQLLRRVNDGGASRAVTIERAFLRAIGGGCASPIAAYAEARDGLVDLRAMLGDEELTTAVFERRAARAAEALEMAVELAGELKRRVGRLGALSRR